MGCLERHADHLAVGCDSVQAQLIADKAAEKEYAVVFPVAYWLGNVMGMHTIKGKDLDAPYKKRGYIALSPELLMSVMKELCCEIFRNGFRKILILNSHGGNDAFLNFFLSAMRYEGVNDGAIMWMSAYDSTPKRVLEDYLANPDGYVRLTDEELTTLERFAKTGTGGGHADFVEVAHCMAKDTALVRPELYDSCNGISTGKADYLAKMGVHHGMAWSTNAPAAYEGYPSHGCTENIGKVMLEYTAKRVAQVFGELKNDEFCVQMAKGDI